MQFPNDPLAASKKISKSRTFLSARWENLIMANYTVSPELLKPYLPNGVELDYFEGECFVSLVGFMFKKTSLFKVPIPFLGTFEEVNLRFYVKRVEGNTVKRGVVFINETVPHRSVAWVANKLYREHYICIPTRNKGSRSELVQTVRYEWKINNEWDYLQTDTSLVATEMSEGSIEEFIFEHYYGYTRIDDRRSQEYRVNHPRWLVNKVYDYSINCNFALMYGTDFSFLNEERPHSVIFSGGSEVTIDWKRSGF